MMNPAWMMFAYVVISGVLAGVIAGAVAYTTIRVQLKWHRRDIDWAHKRLDRLEAIK